MTERTNAADGGAGSQAAYTVRHIPVCPFCQRLEILLELRGQRDAVAFHVVDVTKPRDPALLAKTLGTTALPVLEAARCYVAATRRNTRSNPC